MGPRRSRGITFAFACLDRSAVMRIGHTHVRRSGLEDDMPAVRCSVRPMRGAALLAVATMLVVAPGQAIALSTS